jgi:hypothetical protein
MSYLLKAFYIVWFLCKPILYLGISIWLLIHRNDTATGSKKFMRIPSAKTFPIFGYRNIAAPAPFFQKKIFRAISLLFAIAFVFLMIDVSLPYIEDIPNLLTGNYNYVEGTPQKIWHRSKEFNEYVQVNGSSIEFPISSTMKMGKYYRISYLPNSGFGIAVEELSN